MRLCASCNKPNKEGFLYCEECGRPIDQSSATTIDTKQFQEKQNTPAKPYLTSWGTASFSSSSNILIHIHEHNDPIALVPSEPSTIGRADLSTKTKPDVDLSRYGALEKGVSRIHAKIYRDDDTLMLEDLTSSNGTYLNGNRLVPRQPRIVRDGDEIRFGKLIVFIYFK